MLRLRIKEVAEAKGKGFKMARLGRLADVNPTTMRRMWFNTSTGTIGDDPLENVNLPALERIAAILGVAPADLIEQVDE